MCKTSCVNVFFLVLSLLLCVEILTYFFRLYGSEAGEGVDEVFGGVPAKARVCDRLARD